MDEVKVAVKNISGNALPEYATQGSAGVDLRAWLQEPVIIKPMQRMLIQTGVFLELPQGYEAQVRPRSGLAVKNGITCLNTPGTIDSDYRGEIKVLLINLGSEDFTIENNDRIAQMVVSRVGRVKWTESDEALTTSSRGSGGFGHTGTT